MDEALTSDDVQNIAAQGKVAELAILKESLDEARAQGADYYDQLLRLKAEFENYAKRMEKGKGDARRWGKEELVLRLVSFLDVMEQAQNRMVLIRMKTK